MDAQKWIKDGKITQLPRRLSDKREIFSYVIEQGFAEGKTYTEREVNEILKEYYFDFALLRRYLVDDGWLRRDRQGQVYIVSKT